MIKSLPPFGARAGRRPAGIMLACALLLSICAAAPAVGQDISVQVLNQLEAIHNTAVEERRNPDIVEDWFDLDLYGDGFRLGLRYSSFAPPDPTASSTGSDFEGITHRFAELDMGDTRLRVGNFTKLFGRGMILRSFENRDLRWDSNLDGFLIEHDGGWWRGSLLSGRSQNGQMEEAVRERTDRFSGLDLEGDYGVFSLGASYLTIDPQELLNYSQVGNPEFQSLRAGLIWGELSVDWEGGRKLPGNDDEEKGKGHVLEASWISGPFSFYGGYKRYRDMKVQSSDGILFNQPPLLLHDHRATLINRHPHELDPNDEEGFLTELSYNSGWGVFLGSYAETRHIDGELGKNDIRESFLEWDHFDVFGFESVHAIFDFKQVTGRTPYQEIEWEYYFTSAIDAHLALGEGSAVLTWEHQHKKSDFIGEYDDELFSLEYQLPSGLSISGILEYVGWDREQQLWEDQIEERKVWGGVQISAMLAERHSLRLFAGSRREGLICLGGVCREEPALEGVELSLISTF